MKKLARRILKISGILLLIVVGLTALGQRIAAAFVLTRDHNPVGFANTYALIFDLDGESSEGIEDN